MKLGPLLCVKLQENCLPQAIFFEKWYFFVSGVYIFSTKTLHPLQNFEVRTLVPPLIPKILLPILNPKKSSPHSARGIKVCLTESNNKQTLRVIFKFLKLNFFRGTLFFRGSVYHPPPPWLRR